MSAQRSRSRRRANTPRKSFDNNSRSTPAITPPIEPRALYNAEAAAQALFSNVRTMERWRKEGTGPRYTKAGRRVMYIGADLLAFLEKQKRTHTGAAA
jgi:Helix-turn-helix domain